MRFLVASVFLMFVTTCTTTRKNEVAVHAGGETVNVSLVINEHVNILQCHVNDSLTHEWSLGYPVFKMIKGDVNNDGVEDIAIGIIKPTRRDSVVRKRLFLYQIRNRSIIPLWLGSSLSHPLEDFAIHQVDSTTFVRSIELEKSGRYLVAEYEWFGFGLTFRKYVMREIELIRAQHLLEH